MSVSDEGDQFPFTMSGEEGGEVVAAMPGEGGWVTAAMMLREGGQVPAWLPALTATRSERAKLDRRGVAMPQLRKSLDVNSAG